VRGEHLVGPLLVTSTDPCGLWRFRRRYEGSAKLLVRPRIVQLAEGLAGAPPRVDGASGRPRPGGALAPDQLREYVYGDDMRHVHWRTSARAGTLMVRHRTGSGTPVAIVVLDVRTDRYPDAQSFELAVEVAASVAAGYGRLFQACQVRAGATPPINVAGPSDVEQMLDRLARLTASESGPAGLAGQLRRPAGSAALCVVTGEPAAEDLDLLTKQTIHSGRMMVLCTGSGASSARNGAVRTVGDLVDLPRIWPEVIAG
jgi:uncharacterized protein (DUF58 family)